MSPLLSQYNPVGVRPFGLLVIVPSQTFGVLVSSVFTSGIRLRLSDVPRRPRLGSQVFGFLNLRYRFSSSSFPRPSVSLPFFSQREEDGPTGSVQWSVNIPQTGVLPIEKENQMTEFVVTRDLCDGVFIGLRHEVVVDNEVGLTVYFNRQCSGGEQLYCGYTQKHFVSIKTYFGYCSSINVDCVILIGHMLGFVRLRKGSSSISRTHSK